MQAGFEWIDCSFLRQDGTRGFKLTVTSRQPEFGGQALNVGAIARCDEGGTYLREALADGVRHLWTSEDWDFVKDARQAGPTHLLVRELKVVTLP